MKEHFAAEPMRDGLLLTECELIFLLYIFHYLPMLALCKVTSLNICFHKCTENELKSLQELRKTKNQSADRFLYLDFSN